MILLLPEIDNTARFGKDTPAPSTLPTKKDVTKHSAAIITTLAILSAGPAAAQHLTEQDGRQVVDEIEKVKAKAFETKDAAIWGSLFADSAVQLPLSGETSVGRPAIQNWFVIGKISALRR